MRPSFSFDVRIAYADTDRMGVVYYANYLTLFERGRTELMRNLNLRYREMEDVHHVYLPVMDASCKYLHPARYDDLIRVVTRVVKAGARYPSIFSTRSSTWKPGASWRKVSRAIRS